VEESGGNVVPKSIAVTEIQVQAVKTVNENISAGLWAPGGVVLRLGRQRFQCAIEDASAAPGGPDHNQARVEGIQHDLTAAQQAF
jgi:hypothetical protein